MITMSPKDLPIYYEGLFKIEDGFSASKPIITQITDEEFNSYPFNYHNNGDTFQYDSERKRIVIRFESAFFHVFFHVLAPILYEYEINNNIEVILLHSSKEKDIFNNSGIFVVKVLKKYNIPYYFVQTHLVYPPVIKNFYYYEHVELCGDFIKSLDGLIDTYRDFSKPNDKKIYVSREGKQNMLGTQLYLLSDEEISQLEIKDDLRIDHEEKLEDFLIKNGFEIYTEGMFENIEDQIKYFDKAKLIVSLSGSGLTNILFLRENTKVIELSTTQLARTRVEFHFHFYLIASLFSRKTYISIPNVQRKYDKIEEELKRIIGAYD